ncbi:hypothetical protein HELRODRAFT_83783 [Helobdella robusta]|uniref:Diacylglycerol kinase n=1 Tax=Helobdella robusta TaxID=6412 RepID=T1G5A3_HELRO|nr:hypothetical protein HELRODRAFT_83783 [Helobdella robusta]ESN99864.1 hypothetical protein HELRODRAFT_83783 [Helobdella robusta]
MHSFIHFFIRSFIHSFIRSLIQDTAVTNDHIWISTNASGDTCYLADIECSVCLCLCKSGFRKKCASCKIVVHVGCIPKLDQMIFKCKPTFCEGSHRNYRENPTTMRHHWVHRRRQDGKCSKCGKSFPQRFSFQNKEIVAIGCSWCKMAYHNKITCFTMSCLEECCSLGEHSRIIIPPFWIIKLPKKRSTHLRVSSSSSSLLSPLLTSSSSSSLSASPSYKSFIVKPLPSPHNLPLLVFINPKSGGNQGCKLVNKFFWYLNPRQVFDLTKTKPQTALELYQKVPNLRILTCGGDGTVGWVLSAIDHLQLQPHPPVAILPLGTGNDMARTLNWGGGYTDEPVSKILSSVEEAVSVLVDRCNIGGGGSSGGCGNSGSSGGGSVTKLPLNVMNNYFSIGADANVTLEFHESREAKPEKFNSRFKNKMFYAGVGGIDILKRSWKDLTEYICLECDGQNMDSIVKHSKFHCLLFLNIPKYAAGTNPWGNSSSSNFRQQKPDDGYLEVVGFTAASLASLQMGAHSGVRVTQCQKACVKTFKSMPVQVDGEPCRLSPSTITIERRNQACMLQKLKNRGSTSSVQSG